MATISFFVMVRNLIARPDAFSSDLNGTLVHQHTMSDMIRIYRGEAPFAEARKFFDGQTAGTVSIQEAFEKAGPLTAGLTLREAIEYTRDHMRYVDGFSEFVNLLKANDVPFIINSTGYSATIYAIREQIGAEKVHGLIGNFLRFGEDADVASTLKEMELEQLVIDYFADPEAVRNRIYDRIKATGVIDLGIEDEEAKTNLLRQYVRDKLVGVDDSKVVHMGDTMGDSAGIVGVAKWGGTGIAFNYNDALRSFIERARLQEEIPGRIILIDPKGESSDLRNVSSSFDFANSLAS
jgi:hypothetical protein